MLHSIGRIAVTQVQSLLRGFLQDGACPFSSVLTVPDIVDRISQTCIETYDRIFTPAVTLCTFLSQIHSDDPSCRAAVARLSATRVAQGLAPCSPLTGGYCKARQRLAEALLHGLMHQSGQRLQQQVPTAWHWHGRAVKIVDGSGVSMPDTEANQQAYPQPGSQAPGLGFPVARLVVVLSLACGAVLAAAVGRIKGQQTSETMLFHGLHTHLERDDVILADRFYCSYWEIALLRGQGSDIVMRLHQRRQVDFQYGWRLGREDHVVSWSKPKRPAWMDEATYAELPATIDIRELRVRVPQRGFRTPRDLRGDDLAGCPGVPQGGTGRPLPSTVACGTGSPLDQTDPPDGRAALQDTRDGAEGDLGPPAGLQPAPGGHGPSRSRAQDGAAPGELARGPPDVDSLLQPVGTGVPEPTRGSHPDCAPRDCQSPCGNPTGPL